MDEFIDYVYTSGTNLLTSFTEGSSIASNYVDDIDASSIQSGNYIYDASGRLTTDKMEGVKPKWDVYDKVVEVVNNNGPLSSGESTPNASSKKIRYRYDASGQRVQRLVFNFNATNGDFESEPAYVQSYVYGMGGELLGVYEQKYVEGELQDNAELKEWPMYGAGRLGLAQPSGTVTHLGTLLAATDKYDRPVDKKRYELTDHLGNVRAVVSDLKLDDGSGNFLPDLKAYYNYYAFGMLQPQRWWEAESYRFGYNGVEKENDVTVKGGIAMADFRMYDARVGRWWGVDKIVKPWESPYAAFFNNPINFADPSGLDPEDDGTTAVMPDKRTDSPTPGEKQKEETPRTPEKPKASQTPKTPIDNLPAMDPALVAAFQKGVNQVKLYEEQRGIEIQDQAKQIQVSIPKETRTATANATVDQVSNMVGWNSDVIIGIPANIMAGRLQELMARTFPGIESEMDIINSFKNPKKMYGGSLSRNQAVKLAAQLARYRAVSKEIKVLEGMGKALLWVSFGSDLLNGINHGSTVKVAHAVLNLAVGAYTAYKGLTWLGITYTLADKILGGKIEEQINLSLYSWRLGTPTANTDEIPAISTGVLLPIYKDGSIILIK